MPGSDIFSFNSGGTLGGGIVDGAIENPNNEYVKELKDGVDVIELYPETPDDVMKYRKSMSNKFGDAQDANPIELLDEAYVTLYCKRNHIWQFAFLE